MTKSSLTSNTRLVKLTWCFLLRKTEAHRGRGKISQFVSQFTPSLRDTPLGYRSASSSLRSDGTIFLMPFSLYLASDGCRWQPLAYFVGSPRSDFVGASSSNDDCALRLQGDYRETVPLVWRTHRNCRHCVHCIH